MILSWKLLVLGIGTMAGVQAQELVSSYHTHLPDSRTAIVHRGFGSAADERAWTVVLAVSLPLAQLRDSLWLVGVVSHLLQANSLNDIGFNPRGARWEEQLAVIWHRASWTLYGGLLHFCKHEIDNADPPDTDEPVRGYQPTKRVIILHGPFVGLRYHQYWTSWWKSVVEGRLHFFPIAQDYRIRGSDDLRWRQLRGSFVLRVSSVGDLGLLRKFVEVAYRSALFVFPLLARHEYRAEAGVALGWLPMGFFVYWEQLFDDLSRPFPHFSRSVGVGLRWYPNADSK